MHSTLVNLETEFWNNVTVLLLYCIFFVDPFWQSYSWLRYLMSIVKRRANCEKKSRKRNFFFDPKANMESFCFLFCVRNMHTRHISSEYLHVLWKTSVFVYDRCLKQGHQSHLQMEHTTLKPQWALLQFFSLSDMWNGHKNTHLCVNLARMSSYGK